MEEKLLMEELAYVQKEVELEGKQTKTALILLFLFGWMGAHTGYLRKSRPTSLRASFFLLTVAFAFPMADLTQKARLAGATIEQQQLASALSVVWVLFILGHFLWFVYDAAKITYWVSEYNGKIADSAKVKVLQARNVQEKLREDAISKIIIEKSIEEILKQAEEVKKEEKKVEEITNIQEIPLDEINVSNVEDILHLQDGQVVTEAFVVGALVNGVKVTNPSLFKSNSNILIADNSEEKDTNKMIAIQIPEKLQDKFGLKDNQDVYGKKILVAGSIKKYYGSYGIKEVLKIAFRD